MVPALVGLVAALTTAAANKTPSMPAASASSSAVDIAALRPARRMQQSSEICAALDQAGELSCAPGSRGSEVCRATCSELHHGSMAPAISCTEARRRGQCPYLQPGECSGECADAPGDVPRELQWSCPVLLRLGGGCAHDLSADDPSIPAGTAVRDVCRADCTGHASCAPAELDLPFLEAEGDSTVTIAGDICVDGGAKFSNDGHVEVPSNGQYAQDGKFSATVWLLKEAGSVWVSTGYDHIGREVLLEHPSRFSGVDATITLWLRRGEWLQAWTLELWITGVGFRAFEVNLNQDSLPMWTHLAVVVDENNVLVFENGRQLNSKRVMDGQPPQPVAVTVSGPRFLSGNGGQSRPAENRCCSESDLEMCDGTVGQADTGQYFDRTGASLWTGVFTEIPPFLQGASMIRARAEFAFDEGTSFTCFYPTAEATIYVLWDGRAPLPHWLTEFPTLHDERVRTSGATMTEGFKIFSMTVNGRSRVCVDMHYPDRTGLAYLASPVILIGGPRGPGDDKSPRTGRFRSAAALGDSLIIGASPGVHMNDATLSTSYRGSLAMLEVHAGALSYEDVQCIYEAGRLLVWNGRMAQSLCHGQDTTSGCTVIVASNRPVSSPPSIDDGSCRFEEHAGGATEGEHGRVDITEQWSVVSLRRVYRLPIVFAGVITRESSVQAIVRVQNLAMDVAGTWRFEIRAEHKACHFAAPPPSSEHVNFVVVEAGISADGWQAGIVRVHDREWHRVSLLREFPNDEGRPVVVSQVQTFDNRTSFVSARHWFPSRTNETRATRLAFFLQAHGDGIWCADGQFYAEYYDSLDLSGSPVATQCERRPPNWHWHAHNGGVPPCLAGKDRTLPSMLFSTRFSTRFAAPADGTYRFSSLASIGSRIVVDGATVLDQWSRCCSTFKSEEVQLSTGFHDLAYEYRSGNSEDYIPTDSYAVLSWTVNEDSPAAYDHSNASNTTIGRELYMDVGWLATRKGTGQMLGAVYQADIVAAESDLVTAITFPSGFAVPPTIVGTFAFSSDLNAHLRLLHSSERGASVAVEYESCTAVFTDSDGSFSWIALAVEESDALRVNQQQTYAPDIDALLSIASSLSLPEHFHWRNHSDPCHDGWSGIECRTESYGTARIVVLDIHSVDLTDQDIPWETIGRLTSLEEISLWNDGLAGIVPSTLCQLTRLRALALGQNKLHGSLPNCIQTLGLELLWIADNSIHGPVAELSPLGQFLQNIPRLNLERNRWAPLLVTEKQALRKLSGPLGVDVDGLGWDFQYSADWHSEATSQPTALDHELSYRQWTSDVPFEGFMVSLEFTFPAQARGARRVGIGRDGDMAVEFEEDRLQFESSAASSSGWTGGTNYVGCFDDHADQQNDRIARGGSWHFLEHFGPHAQPGDVAYVHVCAEVCSDYDYVGMEWTTMCMCDNQLGIPVEEAGYEGVSEDDCGLGGDNCGRESQFYSQCGWMASYYSKYAWLYPRGPRDRTKSAAQECFSSVAQLVPDAHHFSASGDDRSAQGDAHFDNIFCDGWQPFVSSSCDPAGGCITTPRSAGNVIFDGGADMFDNGNFIMTSLMGDCSTDPHDCAFGSLLYHDDFEQHDTNCFGPLGSYQMEQFDALWVFLTANVDTEPLDFIIVGNLGSDGRGEVSELVLHAPPLTGFVKQVCFSADQEPSVNHMIVVDSSHHLPVHSCDYITRVSCSSADSDLDDDIVSGIAPGSPILYLLYSTHSTQGGSCMKEDEHRAIFNAVVQCMNAAEVPSSRNSARSLLLVEAGVDQLGHIVFGGKGPYAGWTRGSPQIVEGPSGFANALRFDHSDWLQLGESGVDIEGSWTLDFYTRRYASNGLIEGVAIASLDNHAHVLVHRGPGATLELGSQLGAGSYMPSGVDISLLGNDWHRITIVVERDGIDSQRTDRRTVYIDAQHTSSVNTPSACAAAHCVVGAIHTCNDACSTNVFAVGGRPDGLCPFQLSMHRVRLYGAALSAHDLDGDSLSNGYIAYQPENSRSVMIVRSTDALEVTWDAVGWHSAAHATVTVALRASGDVVVRSRNASSLWERAVLSAGGISGQFREARNWSQSVASATENVATDLMLRYVEADPCFDLWVGITCSLSSWPVGTEDCSHRINCDALGWPAGSRGSAAVCGSSVLLSKLDRSDKCVRGMSYKEAGSLCAEFGARLCTVLELEQGEGQPEACGYDSLFSWSWAATPPGSCAAANQSLGMAGEAGVWLVLTPAADNTFHEVQIRSEQSSGYSFALSGMFDAHGDNAHGQAAIHYRSNGAMLRFNSSGVREPSYVHVKSTHEDAVFDAVLVVPPKYEWRFINGQQPDDYIHMTHLDLQANGVAAVDLQFTFPYFGLGYTRVWISSFGMVLFESPAAYPFWDLAGVHTAVLAAAGQFDLTRAGTHVSVSQSDGELFVSWHAPLFRSKSSSDVSVALNSNGSILIRWNEVSLPPGGSLTYGLLSWLSTPDTVRIPTSQGSSPFQAPSASAQVVTNGDESAYWLHADIAMNMSSRTVDALCLTNDAYATLPQMTLGTAIAVSAWVHLSSDGGDLGYFTLFSSFQTDACGDSDDCRNALDGTLNTGGWFAVGNERNARPLDLWISGAQFDEAPRHFWGGAVDAWMMVSVSLSGRDLSLFSSAGSRLRSSFGRDLPRILRHNNYVGAAHNAPHQEKINGPWSVTIADFRLYDRGLVQNEMAALLQGATSECCVFAGLKSAFGPGDIDFTSKGMVAASAVSVTTSNAVVANAGPEDPVTAHTERPAVDFAAAEQVNICAEGSVVSACDGTISDGSGPYALGLDCGLRLESVRGMRYTLRFISFDLSTGGLSAEERSRSDQLSIYDGASPDAPLLGSFRGFAIPNEVVSTGHMMYFHFHSSRQSDGRLTWNNHERDGFFAEFWCSGTPSRPWEPADVASELRVGVQSHSVVQRAARTRCISNSLMSVQCCSDVTAPCARARITGIDLSRQSLRGSVPEAVDHFGALRTLKLHDNFLSGTLPTALGNLHILRDLQLSRNQFDMQGGESMSEILGGLMSSLRTFSIDMSSERPHLTKTTLQPSPPLSCRVGEVCTLQLSTRTIDGLQLPHGGLRMHVRKIGMSGKDCTCTDLMDGTYSCVFPPAWTARAADFEFSLWADGEEYVPLQTLIDPSSGAASTVNTYGRLRVVVPPIVCLETHALASGDGSHCICDDGFYRLNYDGGWSCERCSLGEAPTEQGARCVACPFGKYSSIGQSCDNCAPGKEPNQNAGADSCVPCLDRFVSPTGTRCVQCPAEQLADESGTACVCPRNTYNSSLFGGNALACVARHYRGRLDSISAESECISCHDLHCVECEDAHGPTVQAGWSQTELDGRPSTVPWLVFECPSHDACANTAQRRCKEGHTGLLCNVCLAGYSMVGESCELCAAMRSTPLVLLGVVVLLLMGAGLIFCFAKFRSSTPDASSLHAQLTENPLENFAHGPSVLATGNASSSPVTTDGVYMLVRVLWQPLRILVGYVQVVNQIDIVLAIEYPPLIKTAFSVLSPFALDLRALFQLDCLGVGFYKQWLLRVFMIPLVLGGLASLKYGYRNAHNGGSSSDASASLRADIFLIVFLVYPGICNDAFRMFNCRHLGSGHLVLRADYTVSCATGTHKAYQLIALAVILAFSLAVPVGLVALMLKRRREYIYTSDSDRFVARRVADELKMDDQDAADAIRDVSTGREYSFLLNAFKPRYFFWEGFDMVRKLILVGLLVVAGRGSAAQLFFAVGVSCAALLLQVKTNPYKHMEDNLFKAAVEVHIFLLVTTALVIKCLSNSQAANEEVLSAGFYDVLLVACFVVAIPVGFTHTAFSKRNLIRESLLDRGSPGDESSLRAKRRAVRLLQLGLTNADDMRLLSAYFDRLENMVNKWSHVFISYRVASDRELARRLHDELSTQTIEETGQKLRVYLDQQRLEDGQRWDSGFMEGLAKSWVFVPIVSVEAVKSMQQLSEAEDWCDNVLLEWTVALELHQRGQVKSVLPLLVSQGDFFADAQDAFGGIASLPMHVSAATMEQVTMHLQETTGNSSVAGVGELLQQASGQPEPTVQGVVQSILRFQGIKVTLCDSAESYLATCTGRVAAAVSSCLKRVGIAPGQSSDLAALADRAPTTPKSEKPKVGRVPGSAGLSTTESGEADAGAVPVQLGGVGGGLYLAAD